MDKIFNTELIESYMAENNLTKAGFCKICKIDITILDKILAQKINIRISALPKIASALKIKVSELFTNSHCKDF